MFTFSYDVSQQAEQYVRASISNMGGNEGQNSLIQSLNIDCFAILTVDIDVDGSLSTVGCSGNIVLDSGHPEAIEEILSVGEANFEEFLSRMEDYESNFVGYGNLIGAIQIPLINKALREAGSAL
jgi:hypothetical protein